MSASLPSKEFRSGAFKTGDLVSVRTGKGAKTAIVINHWPGHWRVDSEPRWFDVLVDGKLCLTSLKNIDSLF